MVKSSPLLLQQISNKVWNATIKIPELKATLPAFESTFDLNEAADLLTDMFKSHKGKILVVTGAGMIYFCVALTIVSKYNFSVARCIN
jgi:hypothetical protein